MSCAEVLSNKKEITVVWHASSNPILSCPGLIIRACCGQGLGFECTTGYWPHQDLWLLNYLHIESYVIHSVQWGWVKFGLICAVVILHLDSVCCAWCKCNSGKNAASQEISGQVISASFLWNIWNYSPAAILANSCPLKALLTDLKLSQ